MSGEEIMKSAVARLQAVGMFQTTAMRDQGDLSSRSIGIFTAFMQASCDRMAEGLDNPSGARVELAIGRGYIVACIWVAAWCSEANIRTAPTARLIATAIAKV
jgi:hypothetical protein